MSDTVTMRRGLAEQVRGIVRGSLTAKLDPETRAGLLALYKELDKLLGDTVPTAYRPHENIVEQSLRLWGDDHND